MPDGIRQRTSQGGARHGGSGRNDKADGGGGRFRAGGLTKQENRPSCFLRSAVQPPGRCQVKPAGIPAKFQEDRGKLF